MRYMLPVVLWLIVVCQAAAQKKDKQSDQTGTPSDVTVTVDMIGVSRADAFQLVRLDSATMWAKVVEMVRAGTATSECITTATVVPGERGIVECINETRYPTEFDLPVGPAGKAEGKPTPEMLVGMMQSQLFPVGFETRNVGVTMEVISMIRGKTIELELTPSRTVLDRFITYPLGAEKSLAKADQPQFQTFKVQTKITAESGKPVFLASGDMDPSREGANRDKIVLFFVTATVNPTE